MTEHHHKPTHSELGATKQSVTNDLLSKSLCSELLNLPNHTIPHWGMLNIYELGNKWIFKKKKKKVLVFVCFFYFFISLLKNSSIWCRFFCFVFCCIFWHWTFEMFPWRNSLYQSIYLATVSPFTSLWEVKTGFCMSSLELWGGIASPAAPNRCLEDRDC